MTRRIAAVLGAIVLQAVALVLAHELVFLARWGSRYNEALAHAGHGESWSSTVATVLVLGGVLAAIAAWRLTRLGVHLRRRSSGGAAAASTQPLARSDQPSMTALGRTWLGTGPRTALLTATLLTIQENLERSSIGFGPAGPAILLSPEYAGGLWIALLVGLAVGLVAALFEWRRRVLLGRLRTLRTTLVRTIARAGRRPGIDVLPPVGSIIGRLSALRAPPPGSATLPAG